MQTTYNQKEFQAEAAKFIKSLTPCPDRATVVGLYGELGAGKTTFVQAVAKALGVSERIVSPTFLIWKRFKISAQGGSAFGGKDLRFRYLIHVDSYRLKSGDELRKLRFAELLADSRNLIFVEWAERVADLLPTDHIKISFGFLDTDTRTMTAG